MVDKMVSAKPPLSCTFIIYTVCRGQKPRVRVFHNTLLTSWSAVLQPAPSRVGRSPFDHIPCVTLT